MNTRPAPLAAQRLQVVAIGRLKTCVFFFGRMNPPHAGHAERLSVVNSLAKQFEGEPRIYLSTRQSPSDPLPFDRKMHYVRQSFPDTPVLQAEGNGVEPWDSLSCVWQDGFEHLVMVCGSDRRHWYAQALRRFNATPRCSFKVITLASAERSSSTPAGAIMSSTHLRSRVQQGDYPGYAALLAPALPESERRTMFEELRAALKADTA